LPLLDLIDTSLKGYAHLVAQGPLYIVTIAMIFALSTVAAITRNETYHKVFAGFFLVYIVAFIYIHLNVLQ
jgi:hypothetical protein